MEEFDATELQNQALEIDSATAVRCAKVSRLLSDLQLSAADEYESAEVLSAFLLFSVLFPLCLYAYVFCVIIRLGGEISETINV